MATLDPISAFYQEFHRYPGNNKQWWVARAELDDPDNGVVAGDFRPEVLDKLFAGNNKAPRGHYVLNAFNKNRSGVSGVSGIPNEIIDERPQSITFFAGRVWYACNSTVYFSQVLTDRYKAGMCYQDADPTSEHLSDLIATDGGVIPIPEATKIIRIISHRQSVLVFATNGVWSISGGQGGFSALDISVVKISPIGCKAPFSIIDTDQGIFWWADTGILGMEEKYGEYGPIPGAFSRNNITESSIQSYYNDILEEAKKEVKGVYDARNNRILWYFRDEDVTAYQYNRVLIFDLSLGAFYPWRFSSLETNSPIVKGAFVSERLNVVDNTETVEQDGDEVQVLGQEVVVTNEVVNPYPSTVEYFVMQGPTGRFAQVNNANFVDWETADGEGVTYESFVETGYELFNDAMRRKNITYLFAYLRRTENEWNPTDPPTLDDPSSCYLTVKWDWSNSTVSNKWTTPVQVYRPGRFLAMPLNGTYDDGFPMIITKNKVRGNGKSLQFRFGTDERERNFDLHGWSIAVTGGTQP